MSAIFKSKKHFHDVLIIGSGGSGLLAAIFSASRGLNVAVSSKVHPLKSHTIAAQGGINAALGNVEADDVKWHIYDTLKAADGLGDVDSVEYMCKSAPEIITLLSSLGVEFDVKKDGKIDQKIYGGQSTDFGRGGFAHRACYAKDRTGHSIMHKLYEKALSLGVTFYNYNFALDLIHENNKCFGAYFWDVENGITNVILANNTILATGGYTQIYSTTTSANICTGDGNGLAARAGIPLQDMEFVQFHPTALNKVGVLITEASRSAGGKLINGKNERFMNKYEPKLMELATRDVVARAISTEINVGNGAGVDKDHVWLDLTHLTSEQIKEALPTVYENASSFANIDPGKDFIPISPAAHYNMGGIPTNNDCQVVKHKEKDVIFEGLYAIGETASISVHGAGRLGCNSLLDLFVFAKKVGEKIGKDMALLGSVSDPRQYHEERVLCCKQITTIQMVARNDGSSVNTLTATLKQLMNKNVGVFRSEKSLLNAKEAIEDLEVQFKQLKITDHSLSWNLELQHYLELENMITCAKATIQSALWRCESRGAHFRDDYPKKNEDFAVHSIWYLDEEKIYKREVRGGSELVK
jgi:succinate dehydrogenase / fumarate reductase flavoprotein subunit